MGNNWPFSKDGYCLTIDANNKVDLNGRQCNGVTTQPTHTSGNNDPKKPDVKYVGNMDSSANCK